MPVTAADDTTLDAVERWFRSRGIPTSSAITAPAGTSGLPILLVSAAYRKEFLDEMVVELRQSFAVPDVYLASRTGHGG